MNDSVGVSKAFNASDNGTLTSSMNKKKSPSYDIFHSNENHGGSRNRLLFIRKQQVIENNQNKLDAADETKPKVNTRRLNLITNTAMENGR